MKPTTCRQRDCLNFYVRRERMTDAENEIFCLAGIAQPRGSCVRYTAPSWKPQPRNSSRSKRG